MAREWRGTDGDHGAVRDRASSGSAIGKRTRVDGQAGAPSSGTLQLKGGPICLPDGLFARTDDDLGRDVESSFGAPLQRKETGAQQGSVETNPHKVAAVGVSGPASPYPHGGAIGASFGQGITAQAHFGPEPKAACDALGAEAFTIGNHVAFASDSPSVELAGHEAAHTLQQAQGVQLKGGVGQVGDAYERAADQAGSLAARGQSAARLFAGSATSTSSALQLRATESRANGEPSDGGLPGGLADGPLRAFLATTWTKKNHQPSTGIGLFDAWYDPRAGVLKLTVRLHLQFEADEKDRKAGKTHAWTPAERVAWTQTALTEMRTTWSERFIMHCAHPGFDQVPPVRVFVDVHEAPAKEAHFSAIVLKKPSGAQDHVERSEGRTQQIGALLTEQDEAAAIPDISPRDVGYKSEAVAWLKQARVVFPAGSHEIDPLARAILNSCAFTLKRPEVGVWDLGLYGWSATDPLEQDPVALAQKRAAVVRDALESQQVPGKVSVDGASQTASAHYSSRAVTLSPRSAHVTAVKVEHEFGHMLGLGDEYQDEAHGRPAGARTEHTGLVERFLPGTPTVRAQDNDNIMSAGSLMKPQHYVTIIEALASMTGIPEWTLTPVPRPGSGPKSAP